MSFQSFEELEVWKKACRLAVEVYSELSDCKDFGLKEQMQRAAISIASNIAEGHERGGRDFIRFFRIAQGSCAELRTQIYIAKKSPFSMKPSSKTCLAAPKKSQECSKA